MSTFSGQQSKGAMRTHRALKAVEAAERNTNTPVTRTAAFRRSIERLDGNISGSTS